MSVTLFVWESKIGERDWDRGVGVLSCCELVTEEATLARCGNGVFIRRHQMGITFKGQVGLDDCACAS